MLLREQHFICSYMPVFDLQSQSVMKCVMYFQELVRCYCMIGVS